MTYITDSDSVWQHCGRPAEIDDCQRDLADCGVDNCHAVYCSKCGEQLADYDCAVATNVEGVLN